MDEAVARMKILTAEEMGAADRRSVEAGVSVWTLMQHAGGAVARFCLSGGSAAMGWWWCWPAKGIMAGMGWSRRCVWRRLGGACGWRCWGRRGS